MDPWLTCCSEWIGPIHIHNSVAERPLANSDLNSIGGKNRIAALASFLRRSVERGYRLTGILVSHMHYDHADDIILLLELLAADDTHQIDYHGYIDHHGRRFVLYGEPIPVGSLPTIYCDYDTLFYFLTYNFHVPYGKILNLEEQERYFDGNENLKRSLDRQGSREIPSAPPGRSIWIHSFPPNREARFQFYSNWRTWHDVQRRYTVIEVAELVRGDNSYPWYEISDTRGNRLHYDDSYNCGLSRSDRLAAGQEGQEFKAGKFKIVPYIWDHMNTGPNVFWGRRQKQFDDQTAGSLQRMTAFRIYRQKINNAKNTFIIGSAGEMTRFWTRAFNTISIKTDLLIQAIVHPFSIQYRGQCFDTQLEPCLTYMVNNITVNDAILFCHFEEFIREIANSPKYHSDFDRTTKYSLAWILRSQAT